MCEPRSAFAVSSPPGRLRSKAASRTGFRVGRMSSTQPPIFHYGRPRLREILIFTAFYFGPARASRILGGRVREGCNVGVGNQWVINGALVALLSSSGVAQKAAYPGTMPLDVIVQSIQKAQSAVHPQGSYQIIRE